MSSTSSGDREYERYCGEAAIQKIRAVVKEWDAVDLNHWRENHTRYGVIDPIIRELGWDTSDPKECHPEYPHSYQNGRRADYAMFGTPDVQAIGNNAVPPDIIIKSKPLRAELDRAAPQLQRYAQASPRMQSGVAVLTNGNQWWIYDLSLRSSSTSKRVEQVEILTDDPQAAAQILHQRLGRSKFG